MGKTEVYVTTSIVLAQPSQSGFLPSINLLKSDDGQFFSAKFLLVKFLSNCFPLSSKENSDQKLLTKNNSNHSRRNSRIKYSRYKYEVCAGKSNLML